MSDRCVYPRPTVIPSCRRGQSSWSMNRALLTTNDDDGDFALLIDDLDVPWTRRMFRFCGPCSGPIMEWCI